LHITDDVVHIGSVQLHICGWLTQPTLPGCLICGAVSSWTIFTLCSVATYVVLQLRYIHYTWTISRANQQWISVVMELLLLRYGRNCVEQFKGYLLLHDLLKKLWMLRLQSTVIICICNIFLKSINKCDWLCKRGSYSRFQSHIFGMP